MAGVNSGARGAEDGRAHGAEDGRARGAHGAEDGRAHGAHGAEDGRARGAEDGRARGAEDGRARGAHGAHGAEDGRARGAHGAEDGRARGARGAHGAEDGRARGAHGAEDGRAHGAEDGRARGSRGGRKILTMNITSRRVGVVALILAGVFAGLGTPGISPTPYFAFVAFIPMFWVWDNVRSHSTFTKGYIFGFAYFFVNSIWLYNTAYQYGLPAIVGLVVYVVLFGLAFYYALIALFYSRVKSPLLVGSFVGGVELLKGVLLTGYPFGNVGVMLHGELALIQGASFYGEIGLSVLVITVSLGVYRAIMYSRRNLVYVALGLAGLLLPNLYYAPYEYGSGGESGASQLHTDLPSYREGYSWSGASADGVAGGVAGGVVDGVVDGEYSVLLVQTGLDQRYKWSVRRHVEVMSYVGDVIREAARIASETNPDIVVFPESVYPQNMNGVGEIEVLLNTYFPTTPVLIGVIYNRLANGSVTDLSSNATARSYFKRRVAVKSFTSVYAHRSVYEKYTLYDKNRLVLLGEYLPLYSLLKPVYNLFYGFESGEGYSSGEQIGAISVANKFRILPLLCMEASFSSAVTRYQPDSFNVIAIMGNDDWFKSDRAKEQHLAMHTMRAVESRKYVLRSGQTGITTVIEPSGAYENSEADGVAFMLQSFQTSESIPLFARIHYWWLALPLFLGMFLWVRRFVLKKVFTN